MLTAFENYPIRLKRCALGCLTKQSLKYDVILKNEPRPIFEVFSLFHHENEMVCSIKLGKANIVSQNEK